jgi:hypothetical protein
MSVLKKTVDFVGEALIETRVAAGRDERIANSGVDLFRNRCHNRFSRDLLIREYGANLPPPFPSPEELKTAITVYEVELAIASCCDLSIRTCCRDEEPPM